jgi:hypothetical protein
MLTAIDEELFLMLLVFKESLISWIYIVTRIVSDHGYSIIDAAAAEDLESG